MSKLGRLLLLGIMTALAGLGLVACGGGGRDNVAQAGGRDPSKLDEALSAARDAIEAKLAP